MQPAEPSCATSISERSGTHKACEAADQLLLVTTALSVVIMAAVYLLKPFILHVVFGNITAEVERNCNIYLMIVAASIPFLAVYNGCAAIFRAQGDSKTPMKISIVMNLINISGNALLVYALKFGVDGVAIPTLLSRMYAAVAAFVLVHNKRYLVRCSYPVKVKPDFHMLKKILGIGIPNGLENSMFQLGKIMVLSMITQFGTASIAANAVSNTIAVFQTLPGMAIGNAVLTVSAQCAGAGDYEQVKYYAKKLHIIIYTDDRLLSRCHRGTSGGASRLQSVCGGNSHDGRYHRLPRHLLYDNLVIAFNLPNVLRASNDVAFCMILSILSMWICRIGMSYVLGVRMGFGVFGVWVAMTMDWVVRAIFLCPSLSKREVAASDVMKNTECFGERERKNDTSGGSYYYEKRKETDSRSGDCAGDCRCGEIPGKPGGERRTALYRGIGHRHVYRYDCECLLQAEQRDSAGN